MDPPDTDFLSRKRIGRREEPEEELPTLIRVCGDGQQAGVRLANVEGNIRYLGAINSELCEAC